MAGTGVTTTALPVVTNGKSEQSENIPPSQLVQPKLRVPSTRMSMAPAVNVPAPPVTQNSGARPSYVVKEVERLKENREKRRARQAVLKEEKTALMNMDPGNPNWELAKMIR